MPADRSLSLDVALGNHPRALILTAPPILTTLVMCPRANSKSARSGSKKLPANPTWLLRFTTKPSPPSPSFAKLVQKVNAR
jgi:hypothetical protein